MLQHRAVHELTCSQLGMAHRPWLRCAPCDMQTCRQCATCCCIHTHRLLQSVQDCTGLYSTYVYVLCCACRGDFGPDVKFIGAAMQFVLDSYSVDLQRCGLAGGPKLLAATASEAAVDAAVSHCDRSSVDSAADCC
jgi:hypothetical protein